MISRRHLALAGLGLGAAAVAEALRPRRRLILLKGGTLDASMPKKFGSWVADTGQGIVTPEQAGKLARALYKEIVSRIYYDTAAGDAVMLLAAYGDTQSDLLQVHRPEICYAAVGFDVVSSTPAEAPLGNGLFIPVRQVVATTQSRTENIVYWTRMGEQLPQSAKEQQEARFSNALHGFVADGILVRVSMLGDSQRSFERLMQFIPPFMKHVAAAQRPAMIGSALSAALKTA
ncbi:MAG: EpsI family protein [Phenylobacterium sp.]|uniref:exosortase-associated protein EpsI, V-type n=1 Tax=Phenylobacterium sp. TaxID=1871053 RepID=UPI0025FCF087|nr:exosortase-associated protein EpsI, V-type [Phenylobacterium sp.]MBI1198449.1 EpsI family protein [Phenylobacterium sp.]